MRRRLCEVKVELEDGRQYSVMLEAQSVFQAAVLFYRHCSAPPSGASPPRIGMESVLVIAPVYQVRLKAAMQWASQQAENPAGDRVVITMNGKILPYKKW